MKLCNDCGYRFESKKLVKGFCKPCIKLQENPDHNPVYLKESSTKPPEFCGKIRIK